MFKWDRYEGSLEGLVEWVETPHGDKGSKADPTIANPEFLRWARGHWPPNYEVQFHPAAIFPRDDLDGAEWYPGYPHAHTETMGWDPEITAMIVYVEVAEEGGLIAVGGTSPDDPYEYFAPEPGLALIVDGSQWHGVTPVTKGRRIAIVCAGLPR